ncbi:hypothetical protein ECP03047993_5383 [Escherichia coli P0304799.3]|nr:hypothetical protein ECP03047993_5383 [Escherichia coli P0304799.3]
MFPTELIHSRHDEIIRQCKFRFLPARMSVQMCEFASQHHQNPCSAPENLPVFSHAAFPVKIFSSANRVYC